MSKQGSDKLTGKRTGDFERVLNGHGYGFQYAVAELVVALRRDGRCEWMNGVAEFPVGQMESGTRADIVLEHESKGIMLVGECKRVNPALSDWCFIHAPLAPFSPTGVANTIEVVGTLSNVFGSRVVPYAVDPIDTYQQGLEIKTNEEGDPCGKGRGAIEDACGQVCQAVNGLFDLVNYGHLRPEGIDAIALLPVVFTTANLFATQANLKQADLRTGKINLREYQLEPRKWLYYQYPQSPGLKGERWNPRITASLQDFAYHNYLKTIVIVNANALEEYLCTQVRLAN